MRNRPIHHPGGGLGRLHRLLDRVERPPDVAGAAALLGPEHRLVRILDLAAVLRRHVIVATLVLGGGAPALVVGGTWAIPVTSAAAAVDLVLIASLAAVGSSRRSAVRELVIDGGANLALPVIERERERLATSQARASLSRSLDRIVQTAATWPRIHPNLRPVWNPGVIRATAPDLTEIATALRSQRVEPETAARIERLLTDGASQLYSNDPGELQDELDLISRQLEDSRRDPDVASG